MENIDEDIKRLENLIGFVGCELREIEAQSIENLLSRLKTAENKLNRYERECRMFRSFCRKVRKTEKRNVDDYNYGREFAYIQFLNLIDGEIDWEYEGKHFDEADKEIKEWARKKVEENV